MAGLFWWISYRLSKGRLIKINVGFHDDTLLLERRKLHDDFFRWFLVGLGVVRGVVDGAVGFRVSADCLAFLRGEGWLLPVAESWIPEF